MGSSSQVVVINELDQYYEAAKTNNIQVLSQQVSKYANKPDIVESDERQIGLYAIHYAILNNNVEAIQLLSQYELECNTESAIEIITPQNKLIELGTNSTTLHLAFAKNHGFIINFLLEKIQIKNSHFHKPNETNQFPIDIFVIFCEEETTCIMRTTYMQIQLQQQAANQTNQNPFVLAVISQKLDLFCYLIENFEVFNDNLKYLVCFFINKKYKTQSIMYFSRRLLQQNPNSEKIQQIHYLVKEFKNICDKYMADATRENLKINDITFEELNESGAGERPTLSKCEKIRNVLNTSFKLQPRIDQETKLVNKSTTSNNSNCNVGMQENSQLNNLSNQPNISLDNYENVNQIKIKDEAVNYLDNIDFEKIDQ